MHRAALFSILCFLLAGCGAGGMAGKDFDSSPPDTADARSSVRNAIPALETYYLDNGTYAGASLRKLRAAYDPMLDHFRVVRANKQTYCLESTVGGKTFSKRGPAVEILPGAC